MQASPWLTTNPSTATTASTPSTHSATASNSWSPMTDQDEIRNLIARYFQLLDDRDFERWAALLVADASVTINGVERWPPNVQIMGQRGKHISVNQIIDVDTDSTS